MAQPIPVSEQINAANCLTVAQSSAVAVGLARTQLAHAVSLSMLAASQAQSAARTVDQATVITAVRALLAAPQGPEGVK